MGDEKTTYLGWNSPHFTKYLVFLNFSFQRFMSRRLKEIELSLSSYPVLLYLYYASKSGLTEFTQAHLVRETGQDKGLLSRSLQSLAKIGYIETKTNPENRLYKLVSITHAGIAAGEQVRSFVHEWETQFWDDILPDSEKECCLNAVRTMVSAIMNDEHYRNAS